MANDQGMTLWEVLIASGMLMVNFIGAIVGGTWALARDRAKLIAKMDEDKAALERQINDKTNEAMHNFGETVSAIRAKITEMELWNRDNFVSKGTFQTVVEQIRQSWQRFEDKIDKRLDRIDAKLDNRDG